MTASNAAEEATGVPEACRRAQQHPDWSTDPTEQQSLVVEDPGADAPRQDLYNFAT